jgi:hypothetical protein
MNMTKTNSKKQISMQKHIQIQGMCKIVTIQSKMKQEKV